MPGGAHIDIFQRQVGVIGVAEGLAQPVSGGDYAGHSGKYALFDGLFQMQRVAAAAALGGSVACVQQFSGVADRLYQAKLKRARHPFEHPALNHPPEMHMRVDQAGHDGFPRCIYDLGILKDMLKRADEFGFLSKIFQNMAQSIQLREDKLKKRLQALQIEIDNAKEAKEVAEIVETEYFQKLREKARSFRKAQK